MSEPKKYFHGIPTFYGVYEGYKKDIMTFHSQKGWARSTVEQYDGIVLNHIVPHLTAHDSKHIGMYVKQEFLDALERLRKQGKNAPGEPYQPWDENGIPAKASYLMEAVVATASDHLLCEDLFGPREIHRTGGGGGRTGEQHIRQKKSLSVMQEMKVYRYLKINGLSDNCIAGLMLMFALGLRNNEACGANFAYIREFVEYPGHYYLIVPQTTELGASTLKVMGKTANSGRRIPLPDSLAQWLMKLQAKRIQLAERKGYTGKPENLPIACKKNVPWERCSSEELSIAARNMFEDIGMRLEELTDINLELMEEAQCARDELEEDEFKELEADPTAYLLRRNFATHIAILGLSEAQIRYIIGHKIEDEYVQRRAFGDEKMLFRIKRKLDQRPLLNDVSHEKFIIMNTGRVTLDGTRKLVLDVPADQISNLRISATAKEPGDEICVKVMNNKDTNSINAEFLVSDIESTTLDRTIDGIRFYHEQYLKSQ